MQDQEKVSLILKSILVLKNQNVIISLLGLATFVKKRHKATFENYSIDKISATLVRLDDLVFVFLYLSEGFDCHLLTPKLEEWIADQQKRIAIIGDTNIDYLQKKHKLPKFLEHKNFKQIVQEPTHELGGLLDHVYINPKLMNDEYQISQRCTYFSDHDVITLFLPRK